MTTRCPSLVELRWDPTDHHSALLGFARGGAALAVWLAPAIPIVSCGPSGNRHR